MVTPCAKNQIILLQKVGERWGKGMAEAIEKLKNNNENSDDGNKQQGLSSKKGDYYYYC